VRYCGQAEKIWKFWAINCSRSSLWRLVLTILLHSSGEGNCNFIVAGSKKGIVNSGVWDFNHIPHEKVVEGSEAGLSGMIVTVCEDGERNG
jgi:hypothetical protein